MFLPKSLMPSRNIAKRCMSSLCHANLENGIKRITMVAPKTRNALSLEMLNQLDSEIQQDKPSEIIKHNQISVFVCMGMYLYVHKPMLKF